MYSRKQFHWKRSNKSRMYQRWWCYFDCMVNASTTTTTAIKNESSTLAFNLICFIQLFIVATATVVAATSLLLKFYNQLFVTAMLLYTHTCTLHSTDFIHRAWDTRCYCVHHVHKHTHTDRHLHRQNIAMCTLYSACNWMVDIKLERQQRRSHNYPLASTVIERLVPKSRIRAIHSICSFYSIIHSPSHFYAFWKDKLFHDKSLVDVVCISTFSKSHRKVK